MNVDVDLSPAVSAAADLPPFGWLVLLAVAMSCVMAATVWVAVRYLPRSPRAMNGVYTAILQALETITTELAEIRRRLGHGEGEHRELVGRVAYMEGKLGVAPPADDQPKPKE